MQRGEGVFFQEEEIPAPKAQWLGAQGLGVLRRLKGNAVQLKGMKERQTVSQEIGRSQIQRGLEAVSRWLRVAVTNKTKQNKKLIKVYRMEEDNKQMRLYLFDHIWNALVSFRASFFKFMFFKVQQLYFEFMHLPERREILGWQSFGIS